MCVCAHYSCSCQYSFIVLPCVDWQSFPLNKPRPGTNLRRGGWMSMLKDKEHDKLAVNNPTPLKTNCIKSCVSLLHQEVKCIMNTAGYENPSPPLTDSLPDFRYQM